MEVPVKVLVAVIDVGQIDLMFVPGAKLNNNNFRFKKNKHFMASYTCQHICQSLNNKKQSHLRQ